MQTERERLLNALLDAVQKSQHFSSIPLPASLDNCLEELNEKYGYNKIDKKFIPKFDDEEVKEEPEFENIVITKPTREELSKKLRDKLKNLKKRTNNVKPKTIM
jgi:hypothetical protein